MTLGLQKLAGEDPQLAPAHRPGDRADHPVGDGRTAPGDHHRPPAPRIRRRGEYRRAPGRVSRDDLAAAYRDLHPQEADRRVGPVRRGEDHVRAAGAQRGRACSRTRWSAARCRGNTSRRSRRASKSQAETGVLAGFPTVDFRYLAPGRQVPRRRQLGAGLRDRRQGVLPGRHEEGRRRSSWSR